MRVILDTNLWISFLISSKYNKFYSLLTTYKCTLLFSKELLEEFIAVAKRPKINKYISENELQELLEVVDQFAEFINVTSSVTICRDPKDNFLLSLAIDGNADYLLTGDKDLLVLKKVENTKIVTITEFFGIIKS